MGVADLMKNARPFWMYKNKITLGDRWRFKIKNKNDGLIFYSVYVGSLS